jgi:hypothetical protein
MNQYSDTSFSFTTTIETPPSRATGALPYPLLHIRPPGFTKIRHYGILGNNRRAKDIPLAGAALEHSPWRTTSPPPTTLPPCSQLNLLRCPRCQGDELIASADSNPTGVSFPSTGAHEHCVCALAHRRSCGTVPDVMNFRLPKRPLSGRHPAVGRDTQGTRPHVPERSLLGLHSAPALDLVPRRTLPRLPPHIAPQFEMQSVASAC